METMISNLVTRFEKGSLTRRELVQGLAMIAAASGSSSAAPAQTAAIKGARIDHVSIQVNDLARSVDFYRKVFGFTVVGEDKPNEITRLGIVAGKTIVSLHHKSPTAVVDHFAIGLDSFNREAVTRELKQYGLTPDDNLDAGFHIKDPDGMNVQIV